MEDTQYIIWKPMNDYSQYSREQMPQVTDKYMKNLLRKYDQWERLMEKYKTAVNRMLRERTAASEIVKLVREDDFQDCTTADYLFTCFSVACQIGVLEEDNGRISNMNGCDSMEEVCERMQHIIFGLRRIEFDWEEEQHQLLLEQIDKWNISYVFLAEMTCQEMIVKRVKIATELARLLKKQGKHRESMLLLFYMANRLKCKTEVVMAFTNVLLEMGDIHWGNEMLQQIQDPSPEILRLQAMLAEKVQD